MDLLVVYKKDDNHNILAYDAESKKMANYFQPNKSLAECVAMLNIADEIEILPATFTLNQLKTEQEKEAYDLVPTPLSLPTELTNNFMLASKLYLSPFVSKIEPEALLIMDCLTDVYISNIHQLIALTPHTFGACYLSQSYTYVAEHPHNITDATLHITNNSMLKKTSPIDIPINLDYPLLKSITNHEVNKFNFAPEECHIQTMENLLPQLMQNIKSQYNDNQFYEATLNELFSDSTKQFYINSLREDYSRAEKNNDASFVDIFLDDYYDKRNPFLNPKDINDIIQNYTSPKNNYEDREVDNYDKEDDNNSKLFEEEYGMSREEMRADYQKFLDEVTDLNETSDFDSPDFNDTTPER